MNADRDIYMRQHFRSRRFWVPVFVSLVLLAAGLGWLTAHLNRSVGIVLILSGGLGTTRLLIERWRFDHGYGPFADWRPSRRAYLVSIAGLCIGFPLAVMISGHTNPWREVGAWLISLSVTGAGVLAVRRAMLNTERD